MPRFEFVAGRSHVSIEARSSVHPIRVTSDRVAGGVDATVAGGTITLGGGHLEVEVADLRSGNPLVDLETRRRIDLRRHPRIVAELTEARPTDDPLVHDGQGVITFHGADHTASGRLQVELSGEDELTLSGEGTFDVRRWGLEPPRLLLLKVHPEVRVHIHLVAHLADAPGASGT